MNNIILPPDLSIEAEIGLKANYKLIRASEWDIAEAVVKRDDSKLWTAKEAFDSLREKGEALRIWFEILKGGLPSFAKESEYHNLVPSILRNELALLISGTTITPTLKANYFALGTDSTAAANADLTLGTETLRALFTNRSAILNVASLDVFFDSAQVGGNTYSEAGVFVDGSASVDTGYLLSRVIINESMGATETLTINATFTIT